MPKAIRIQLPTHDSSFHAQSQTTGAGAASQTLGTSNSNYLQLNERENAAVWGEEAVIGRLASFDIAIDAYARSIIYKYLGCEVQAIYDELTEETASPVRKNHGRGTPPNRQWRALAEKIDWGNKQSIETLHPKWGEKYGQHPVPEAIYASKKNVYDKYNAVTEWRRKSRNQQKLYLDSAKNERAAKRAADKAAREEAGVMREGMKLEREEAHFEVGVNAKLRKIHKAMRKREREVEAEAVHERKRQRVQAKAAKEARANQKKQQRAEMRQQQAEENDADASASQVSFNVFLLTYWLSLKTNSFISLCSKSLPV